MPSPATVKIELPAAREDALSKITIAAALVWAGTWDAAYAATATIDGTTISKVALGVGGPTDTENEVIDGSGYTLMPGLVKRHCRPSVTCNNEPPELGLLNLFRILDATCSTYCEIRRCGIRVVVGGDYGIVVMPMGQNARDIAHFVRYFGYEPVDTLKCVIAVGQSSMGRSDDLGQVKDDLT